MKAFRFCHSLGVPISPIGFGAFKIGRNTKAKYPAAYELPDDRSVERLLNGVLDLGISLIDTAPAYGTSEERIGLAIGHRRGEFVLSTKVGENFDGVESTYRFDRESIFKSLERSLIRLRTNVIDIVFIHAHRDDLSIALESDAIASLQDAKTRGMIRAVGFSATTIAGAQAAMTGVDALMLEFNSENPGAAAMIAESSEKGLDVFVKKGLGSGRLPAREAIQFGLGQNGVTSLIIGSLNLDHLAENLQAAVAEFGFSKPCASR